MKQSSLMTVKSSQDAQIFILSDRDGGQVIFNTVLNAGMSSTTIVQDPESIEQCKEVLPNASIMYSAAVPLNAAPSEASSSFCLKTDSGCGKGFSKATKVSCTQVQSQSSVSSHSEDDISFIPIIFTDARGQTQQICSSDLSSGILSQVPATGKSHCEGQRVSACKGTVSSSIPSTSVPKCSLKEIISISKEKENPFNLGTTPTRILKVLRLSLPQGSMNKVVQHPVLISEDDDSMSHSVFGSSEDKPQTISSIPSQSDVEVLNEKETDKQKRVLSFVNSEHCYGKPVPLDSEPFLKIKDGNVLALKNKPDAVANNSELVEFGKPINGNLLTDIESCGDSVNNLFEKVACFKCKFCVFLSLSEEAVTYHAQQAHASHVPVENNAGLNCPGCQNIFFSKRSLEVHLYEDHNTADEELKEILNSFGDVLDKLPNSKRSQSFPGSSFEDEIKSKELRSAVKNRPFVNQKEGLLCDGGYQQQLFYDDVPDDETGKIRVRNMSLLGKLKSPSKRLSNIASPTDKGSNFNSNHEEYELKNSVLAKPNGLTDASLSRIIDTSADEGDNQDESLSEDTACFLGDEIDIEDENNRENFDTSNIDFEKQNSGDHLGFNISTEIPLSLSKETQLTVRKSRRLMSKPLGKPLRKNAAETVSRYRCGITGCSLRFSSNDNLQYHIRCHVLTDEPPFTSVKVKVDDESCSQISKLGYRFVCPECSTMSKTWTLLKNHLWHHHSIDMELHSCDKCNYKTARLTDLVNLHKRNHGTDRPFLCDSCGKGFKTSKALSNHKVFHIKKDRAASGRVDQCSICGRSFADTRMLKSHIEAVHNKIRPYMCSECGHTAASRSSLKIHLRQHTGDRPYKCDVCSYQSADHNSLRRHKQRHSGEKQYKCPHCTYSSIQSTTFKAHLKSKHPDEAVGMVFCCSKCTFQSVSHEIYLAHIAQHDIESSSVKIKLGASHAFPQQILNSEEGFTLASVSENCPIFVSIGSEDADTSVPSIEAVVENISEVITPGSQIQVLYDNIANSLPITESSPSHNKNGSSRGKSMGSPNEKSAIFDNDKKRTTRKRKLSKEKISKTGDLS